MVIYVNQELNKLQIKSVIRITTASKELNILALQVHMVHQQD
jgi:hypothetical protein